MFKLEKIVRKNVSDIVPYQVSRDKYLNDDKVVFLDNCENNYGSVLGKGLERYPSSSQSELKAIIAENKGIKPDQLVLGNGSDELIDLLMRCFAEPNKEGILVCEPTFGMYRIYAKLNALSVTTVELNKIDFSYNVELILKSVRKTTKIIFICSPNNPTGTSMSSKDVVKLCKSFDGLVVLDEAYIDFSTKKSALLLINEIPNLLVLQTFSKGFGLAGLRVGAAYANAKIVEIINKVRPPFNLNTLSQQLLQSAIETSNFNDKNIEKILQQKKRMYNRLIEYKFVKKIYESDGNFFLMKVTDAKKLSDFLLKRKILISNRSSLLNCENCVRISVGTKKEMDKLFNALNEY